MSKTATELSDGANTLLAAVQEHHPHVTDLAGVKSIYTRLRSEMDVVSGFMEAIQADFDDHDVTTVTHAFQVYADLVARDRATSVSTPVEI